MVNPTSQCWFFLSCLTPAPTLLEWPFQEQLGSGLISSAPGSGVSDPACTNGVWPPLRPVNVAQKNKLSTILSSSVQSIDHLMDCMAWRFWKMRQSNGCSTLAPRSNVTHGWRNLFQSGRHKWTSKTSRKCFVVWIGDYDVTIIEIWRHYLYTIWKFKLHAFRWNYTTMKTYRWTTWNEKDCYRGDPGQQHHSDSSYVLFWLNKTVRCLRHWNFNLLSFLLSLLLLCGVSCATINRSSHDKFSIVE